MVEHRVTVLPSGHEFHTLGEETLLDAALRSGLNIDFSCGSGSCGDCRARLIEGELGQEDFHEHHFSAADKARGLFLLCTAHAAGDLVIEAGEARVTSDIPHQQITTRLGKVGKAGEQLRILQLKTPRTNPLRFLAGQHVELTLPGVGSIDSTIASCPCNGSQLQFHVPYDEQSPFVKRLFSRLRHGTSIELSGPFGEMTLDDESPRPILLIAQGYELAPMKSLVEHAINLDLKQPIRFIWLAREGEHYMTNVCRSWGEALDDYRFIPLTYQGREEDRELVGYILRVIAKEVGPLDDWDLYWAGSSSFSQALEPGLRRAGADKARLFSPRRRTEPHPQPGGISG